MRVFPKTYTDFTGGLNLTADPTTLSPNELADCLNVVPVAEGGIVPRTTTQRMHTTALGAPPKSIWTYRTSGGTDYIHVSYSTKLAYSTGGNFTDVAAITQTTGLRHRAATLIGNAYVVNGTDDCVKINGTTGTRLADSHGAYNENLAAPDGGNFPKARYVAVFAGRMFAAYTSEGGTAYPNRVRFSHPVNITADKGPEDWRQLDYIDVDPGDGDEIQGLATMGDRLFVIKRSSIHVITGYDADSFQRFPVSTEIGAVGPDALVVNERGLHVFHWPTGLWMVDARGRIEHHFHKLHHAILMGDIPDAYAPNIALGSIDQRVWVGIPWEAATYNDHALLYDHEVGRGAWSFHDLALGPMVEYRPQGADNVLLAIDALDSNPRGRYVQKLEQDNFGFDNYTGTNITRSFSFTTAWFTLGEPMLAKRWKRAEVLLNNEVAAILQFRWLRDFDQQDSRSFNIDVPGVTGTTLIWGTGLWGTGTWGGDLTRRDTSFKTPPAGRADVVALRFVGLDPATSVQQWEFHGVTLKYVPKRVR